MPDDARSLRRAVSPNLSKKRKAHWQQAAGARRQSARAALRSPGAAGDACADQDETHDLPAGTAAVGLAVEDAEGEGGEAGGAGEEEQAPSLAREQLEDLEDEVLELQAQVAHLTEQVRAAPAHVSSA